MKKYEAIKIGREIVARRPDLKDQVRDILSLMEDEIEDEGSETHETEMAIDDLKALE